VDWIDEEHFVTCSSDKLIKVWNIKMEELFVIETGSPEDIKNPKKI
jgi:WD40 repeat protein